MIGANTAAAGLLVATIGIAAISGWFMMVSVEEGDAGSAWGWAGLFLVISLVGAWCFWRLVVP
jgi:hypothetical protein